MFTNKTQVEAAVQLVAAVLARRAEQRTTSDLVRALDAALFLAAVERAAGAERDRWVDTADQINTWLAVRCLCGDPAAVVFFNEGADRDSTWAAA